MIEGIEVIELKSISNDKGKVFHIIKKSSAGFAGFGEAYFTEIIQGEIKGWRKHLKLTMNLVIAIGKVRIVLFDDRPESTSKGQYYQITLSHDNYKRLTIPPKIWVALQGLGNCNKLLNIASDEHDPDEAVTVDLEVIPYEW